jgi:CBS domain-containing protein
MLAHHIMTSDVITVGADSTVVEAADTMLRHHISGLPVVDAAGDLLGILSEGDFIRRAEIGTERKRGRWLSFLVGRDRIASDFVHEHGRKVHEIMTPHPLTVTEDTPLDEMVRIMEAHDVKRLPVVRGKRVVGIVTRSDFLAAAAGLARNLPHPRLGDEDIRRAVSDAIGQASWRPRRLNITVGDGIVTLRGVVESYHARQAAIVAAENVPGVKGVIDGLCERPPDPPPEEDLGGGDFVSLQEQPSTRDDEPL